MLRRLIPLVLILALGSTSARGEFRAWQDIRWENVERQGQDFSCGVASLITLSRFLFRESYSEVEILLDHLGRQHVEDREDLTENGLTMLDLVQIAENLGYHGHAVRIGLDGLVRSGMPAIVYVERDDYRHFVVVKAVEARQVHLLDPAAGNKKIFIDQFLDIWVGTTALFLTK